MKLNSVKLTKFEIIFTDRLVSDWDITQGQRSPPLYFSFFIDYIPTLWEGIGEERELYDFEQYFRQGKDPLNRHVEVPSLSAWTPNRGS